MSHGWLVSNSSTAGSPFGDQSTVAGNALSHLFAATSSLLANTPAPASIFFQYCSSYYRTSFVTLEGWPDAFLTLMQKESGLCRNTSAACCESDFFQRARRSGGVAQLYSCAIHSVEWRSLRSHVAPFQPLSNGGLGKKANAETENVALPPSD
jgi:hypothetical protein